MKIIFFFTAMLCLGCSDPWHDATRRVDINHSTFYLEMDNGAYKGYFWPEGTENVVWLKPPNSVRLHTTLNKEQAKELRDTLNEVLGE